jgi:hypothetical protein
MVVVNSYQVQLFEMAWFRGFEDLTASAAGPSHRTPSISQIAASEIAKSRTRAAAILIYKLDARRFGEKAILGQSLKLTDSSISPAPGTLFVASEFRQFGMQPSHGLVGSF